jgi:Lrp/AsnC family leucine-responsive transcriptional regulator
MAIPEVEDVVLVTGDVDMVVRARVRDHTHLRDLLHNHLWQIDGIQRTETSLAIAEMPPKNAPAEVLAALLGESTAAADRTAGGSEQ